MTLLKIANRVMSWFNTVSWLTPYFLFFVAILYHYILVFGIENGAVRDCFYRVVNGGREKAPWKEPVCQFLESPLRYLYINSQNWSKEVFLEIPKLKSDRI